MAGGVDGAQQGAVAVVVAALRDVVGLVLPVACAGCGLPDVPLCVACTALLHGPPRRCEDRAGRLDRLDGRPLPVWALADAVGPVRETVVQWKDRGRADLTPVLGAALAAAAGLVVPGLVGGGGPGAAGAILVVPAPSTAAARRRRGEHRVGRLAVLVARRMAVAGVPAVAVEALVRRGAGDQAGRGRAQRGGVREEVALHRRGRRVLATPGTASSGGPPRVLLVDDVLTTGATLAASRRVLEGSGASVVGALVLASTPPPGTSVPRRPGGGVGTAGSRPEEDTARGVPADDGGGGPG
ncbi:ComF family protein [Cellulomonas endophytica]|uniref:ComF family protein n=1 Tax=Cellulomonas endophytica TaxID=2494735 RepID=UPI00196AF664|nr:ComF family protein [Cellulomonas endophytica]